MGMMEPWGVWGDTALAVAGTGDTELVGPVGNRRGGTRPEVGELRCGAG